ncbi:MAG: hypothetical protein Q9184_004790 [Pyrenodesmia sp. 2 TL-2023]
MASEHVLRIPRTDSPGDYILLNTTSSGSSPLDLQLLATEGSEPYVKALKHSRIFKYRAKTNHLSEPQWEDLLRSALLQEDITKSPNHGDEQDHKTEEDPTKDLELVASIIDSKIILTFRISISGIHQKLGDLSLSKDPDAGISLFDWTNTAVAHAQVLQSEARSMQQKLAEQTQAAKRLNEQLEELIQAKKEHEDLLLQRCAILINEKKKKIREQQCLLATAKVSISKLKAVQAKAQRANALHRGPEPSRAGKRKAARAPVASSDEDDGFEDKDVKTEEREDEGRDSEEVTPQHSDLDETEDEADGSDLDSVPAPQMAKGKIMEGLQADRSQGQDGGSHGDEDAEIPPRRDLPFRKGDDEKPDADDGEKEQDTPMADDAETDDDEL